MTPTKLSSLPIGICSGTAFAREALADHLHHVRSKSAPTRSILLTNAMRGTPVALGLAPDRLRLRLDTRHAAEHRDGAVEHAQRALDLDREVDVARGIDDVDAVSFQKQVVAADVIVMPRSCSCSIQSMVAAPSWTSPIL